MTSISSATPAQVKYIEGLLIDTGLYKSRKAWLSAELGRNVETTSDVLKSEASKIIDRLKEIKIDLKPSQFFDEDDIEDEDDWRPLGWGQ